MSSTSTLRLLTNAVAGNCAKYAWFENDQLDIADSSGATGQQLYILSCRNIPLNQWGRPGAWDLGRARVAVQSPGPASYVLCIATITRLAECKKAAPLGLSASPVYSPNCRFGGRQASISVGCSAETAIQPARNGGFGWVRVGLCGGDRDSLADSVKDPQILLWAKARPSPCPVSAPAWALCTRFEPWLNPSNYGCALFEPQITPPAATNASDSPAAQKPMAGRKAS